MQVWKEACAANHAMKMFVLKFVIVACQQSCKRVQAIDMRPFVLLSACPYSTVSKCSQNLGIRSLICSAETLLVDIPKWAACFACLAV